MLISWRQGIQHSLHRGPRLDHDPPFGIRTVIATRGSEGSGRALLFTARLTAPKIRVTATPGPAPTRQASGPPEFFQALDRRLIPLVSSRAFFFFRLRDLSYPAMPRLGFIGPSDHEAL